MTSEKQVDKSHYIFSKYMDKKRWVSIWHQIDEVQKLSPNNVLEIGPGSGLFKKVAATFGVNVETLDIDPELNPDHVVSATATPFADASYDIVCAFQMLEHIPYEVSLQVFNEMARVCRRHVVISLPNAQTLWRYQFHVPKFGARNFFIPRPLIKLPIHDFDGEHYWEINKHNYPIDRIISDFSKILKISKSYRVPENPYHHFFVFEK